MSRSRRRKAINAAAVIALFPLSGFTPGAEYNRDWVPPEPKEGEKVSVVAPTRKQESEDDLHDLFEDVTVYGDARLQRVLRAARNPEPKKDPDESRKNQRKFVAITLERTALRQVKNCRFQFDPWGNPSISVRLTSRSKPVMKTGNGHFFHVS